MDLIFCFNTQPPEGGCSSNKTSRIPASSFNTQPPEGGCFFGDKIMAKNKVSTHSHPKVAASGSAFSRPNSTFQHTATRRWLQRRPPDFRTRLRFNTQPPEGGCAGTFGAVDDVVVSTHSHPKVAAIQNSTFFASYVVSTHSHPKVAAPIGAAQADYDAVSTHSHPKVAAPKHDRGCVCPSVSTHSHPKVAAGEQQYYDYAFMVSTHSHPKVAARLLLEVVRIKVVSTHSHPKVAALAFGQLVEQAQVSTHSHPKVAASPKARVRFLGVFQHTATRRWLRYRTAREITTSIVSTHSHPKVAALSA